MKEGRTRPPRRVWAWLPCWVAGGFLVQIGWCGYLPAVREGRALEGEAALMALRKRSLAAEAEELDIELRMLLDPIYRERVRRTREDPRQPLLTLERARALARAGEPEG